MSIYVAGISLCGCLSLAAGVTVAFATFLVFDLFVFLRINLFLDELTGRADWQSIMMRFRASGSGSLRRFVNLDYVAGIPLKLGAACAIGMVMGMIGGLLGQLRHRRMANVGCKLRLPPAYMGGEKPCTRRERT